jgi:glycosyltransferase involved in cell wall biosynthesis
VIIPTYNRMELLRYTMDALTRQSMPADRFEVLVVDDGSSDSTASMVDGYRDRLDLRYFFQPDEGWRVAAARNIGIRHARADRCVFIDAGVLPHSGCLAAHLTSLDSVPAPAAVCGYVYCLNADNADAERMRTDIDVADVDTTIEKLAAEGRWLDPREGFYRKFTDELDHLPAPWIVYWTCNVSAHTGQLRSVGLFDEAFRGWGGEDVELAYRLHRAGTRFLLNRAASAIHYPHAKSIAENAAAAADNFRYLARKHNTPLSTLLPPSPVRS